MQLKENSQLRNGKYKITKVLGQGGFGITYLALSRETIEGNIGKFDVDVPVAIKEFFVKDNCLRNEETAGVETPEQLAEMMTAMKKQFIKEAKNMSKLDHPHINKVKDVFEENGTVYYVMQYLQGGTLKDLVQEQGAFSEQQSLVFIRQIASALDYMHSQKLCHLDVKPANIMLNNQHEAVLIDFGIAKHYEKNGEETTSTPMGMSNGFSPIEQYQSSLHEFSPATDIYGLSATLYYLITGTTPPDAYVVLEKGLGKRPDTISEQTWLAILQGMQPIRNDRPKNIAEFLSILDGNWIQSENDVTLTNHVPATHSRNYRLFKKAAIGILGALALLLLATFIGHLARDKHVMVDRISCTDHNGETFLYTGEWFDNQPDGMGKAVYADGRHYEGRFEKGLKNDTAATFTDRKGSVFTGTYQADTLVTGKLHVVDGNFTFKGTFSHDKPYNGVWLDQNNQFIVNMVNGKEDH